MLLVSLYRHGMCLCLQYNWLTKGKQLSNDINWPGSRQISSNVILFPCINLSPNITIVQWKDIIEFLNDIICRGQRYMFSR